MKDRHHLGLLCMAPPLWIRSNPLIQPTMTTWICETCNQKVIPVEGVTTIQEPSGFYHTMCCKSKFIDGKAYALPGSAGKLITLEDWQISWEDQEHRALKAARAAQRQVDKAKALAVRKRSTAAEACSGMVAGVGDPKVINATAVERLVEEAELALIEVKEKIDKSLKAEEAYNKIKEKWSAMSDSLKSKN